MHVLQYFEVQSPVPMERLSWLLLTSQRTAFPFEEKTRAWPNDTVSVFLCLVGSIVVQGHKSLRRCIKRLRKRTPPFWLPRSRAARRRAKRTTSRSCRNSSKKRPKWRTEPTQAPVENGPNSKI